MRRTVFPSLVIAAAALAASTNAFAQDTKVKTPTIEEKAQTARRGAGLIVASWSLLDDPSKGTSSRTTDSPLGMGFFRKGLDKHLALETTVGVFRRVVETPGSGGLFGSGGGKTTVFLLPQMTSIKLFPFTTPENKFEPFISGGVGVTIGLSSESGGGALGGSGGVSGLVAGLGGTLGAGIEWRFSEAFGLSGGWHYNYIQFFDKLAGEEMYRGTGIAVGLTYRFQY